MPQLRVVAGPNSNAVLFTGPAAALQIESWLLEPVQDGLTAFAGGGQASATQITAMTARVATVATAGDSVQLPQAVAGLELMIINDAANAMNVFPFPGDTIDKAAANAAVSHMGQSLVIYTCVTAGAWRTEGLSTGFDPTIGLQTLSVQDGLTAKAGGGQNGGVNMTKLLNRIATVGSAADSVQLPSAIAGVTLTIMNGAAVNSMNVFPATGEAVNALGANAAFAMAAGALNIFYCFTNGQWFTK